MFADRDYDKLDGTGDRESLSLKDNDNTKPLVTVDNYLERGYYVVTV